MSPDGPPPEIAGEGETTDDVETDRLARLKEVTDVNDPDWSLRFAPGSFGCHELLDRTSMAMNAVEQWLLEHPACLSRPAWFLQARQAFDALNELYESVAESHLVDELRESRNGD